MKHKIPAIDGALSSITCDRCGQTWQAGTVDATEFTSIDFTGGYGSIFGDGSQVDSSYNVHTKFFDWRQPTR